MNLSNEKKKELQAQYKQLKPDIGLFAVINKTEAKYYLETSQNLKAGVNGTRFKLDNGSHPNRELQKDWQALGADAFEIKILAQIKVDDDKTPSDYRDDLELLRMIWLEKLALTSLY